MAPEDRIFTNLHGTHPGGLKAAMERGDWQEFQRWVGRDPEDLIQAVSQSGLCGRGGAGFPTGKKWAMVKGAPTSGPRYVVVNGDESEPGACKDRLILGHEPHKLLEGAVLAALAIGARKGFIYIRGEYAQEVKILAQALTEARQAGFVGPRTSHGVELLIHKGAGAYICGEETALLESLEGKRGMPRLKPPYPVEFGLYGAPTLINNVETLAAVPTLLRRGPEWFSGLGREGNRGSRIFSVSGHVNHPCVVEEAMGIPLKELINTHGGGVRGGWDNLLAVIPGGASTPLLPKKLCDTAVMTDESLRQMGTFMGTASVVVMDKTTDIVEAIARSAKFYMDESCGQCSPCREGTGWLWRLLKKIQSKQGVRGEGALLESVAQRISGRTICALGDAAAGPVMGLLRHFRQEVEDRLGEPGSSNSPLVERETWSW